MGIRVRAGAVATILPYPLSETTAVTMSKASYTTSVTLVSYLLIRDVEG